MAWAKPAPIRRSFYQILKTYKLALIRAESNFEEIQRPAPVRSKYTRYKMPLDGSPTIREVTNLYVTLNLLNFTLNLRGRFVAGNPHNV